MGKGGHLFCNDTEGVEITECDLELMKWFANTGWMEFYHRLKGSNYRVARALAEGLMVKLLTS